jgi:hypothetical protein
MVNQNHKQQQTRVCVLGKFLIPCHTTTKSKKVSELFSKNVKYVTEITQNPILQNKLKKIGVDIEHDNQGVHVYFTKGGSELKHKVYQVFNEYFSCKSIGSRLRIVNLYKELDNFNTKVTLLRGGRSGGRGGGRGRGGRARTGGSSGNTNRRKPNDADSLMPNYLSYALPIGSIFIPQITNILFGIIGQISNQNTNQFQENPTINNIINLSENLILYSLLVSSCKDFLLKLPGIRQVANCFKQNPHTEKIKVLLKEKLQNDEGIPQNETQKTPTQNANDDGLDNFIRARLESTRITQAKFSDNLLQNIS